MLLIAIRSCTVLNSSLKWTDHVNMITKKEAKRLTLYVL